MLSKEQKTAKGNFPGPCPVVLYPPSADAAQIEAAAASGADAVVLRPSQLELADSVTHKKMEVIWDVRSTEDIRAICDKGTAAASFLLPGADAIPGGLLAALPKDAVGICSVDCEDNEVELGRSLAKEGVKALVVRGSCMGDDDWDLPYARFVIRGLTSKANPEFQMTAIGGSSKVCKRKQGREEGGEMFDQS